MKILSYGSDVTPVIDVCGSCESSFEYLIPYDIRFKKSSNKGKQYVVCPVCGKWILKHVIEYEEHEYDI